MFPTSRSLRQAWFVFVGAPIEQTQVLMAFPPPQSAGGRMTLHRWASTNGGSGPGKLGRAGGEEQSSRRACGARDSRRKPASKMPFRCDFGAGTPQAWPRSSAKQKRREGNGFGFIFLFSLSDASKGGNGPFRPGGTAEGTLGVGTPVEEKISRDLPLSGRRSGHFLPFGIRKERGGRQFQRRDGRAANGPGEPGEWEI